MPWFCINEVHDQTYYSVCFTEKTQPWLGKNTFIEINDEEAKLSIDVLTAKYIEAKKTETRKKGKQLSRQDFLGIIERIIRESDQEGEVLAAMAVYKKITGKEYDAT